MDRVEEIKHALRQVSLDERNAIANWLRDRIDAESDSCAVAEPASAHAHVAPAYMTLEEYFEFEEASQRRHEFVNGLVYAMSGPSVAHARIARELLVALKTHLRAGPCEAFATDLMLRIHLAKEEIIYYPDLIVACNKDEWGTHYVRNPKLVVEILSPSTEDTDRREKAMTYRRVDSIEEYVLVEQEEHRVIVHRRAEGWRPRIYDGPQAVTEFHSISLALPLNQIYAGTL